MANSEDEDRGDHEQPGKTRTWWHPLLVQMLDHIVSDAYEVRGEVSLGKMPLRADAVLVRREDGFLPEQRARQLSVIGERLNRWTLIEYKSPTDLIQRGDLNHLVGCAHLFCAQQVDAIPHRDISLILLAAEINEAFREELRQLDWEVHQERPGVHRLEGSAFTAWMIEADALAGPAEPVLTLFSRVFLRQRRSIIEQLREAGFQGLLYFMLQLVQQFQTAGEAFMIQHKDVDVMNEVAEDLRHAVLEAIPPEERLRGIPPEELLRFIPGEELLRFIPPEERLRGLTLQERLQGLSEEELAQLRSLIEREKEKPE